MRISIVTISYNQAQFLERAILSVLNQNYPELEYIIVDAGSTDGSREIIRTYESRLAKVLFEPDEGPADGLNKGFAKASGAVFGCLNADDEYLPGTLHKVSTLFEKDGSVDVLHAHTYMVDGQGRRVRRLPSNTFDLRRFLYGGVTVAQQSTFYRSHAFRRAGGFNPANRTCWDGELIVAMARNRVSFRLIDDYWSLFRIHDSSISGSGSSIARYRADQQRIFFDVCGRRHRPIDRVGSILARIEKWVLHPKSFAIRVIDAIHGPYNI